MKLDFTSIPQNSRTIIFERFNDQKPNLCTLLKGQEADEAVQKIEDELCVKSFEEFKERFDPTVYEVFRQDKNEDKDEESNLHIEYSLEYCSGANAVSLCKHEFYKAVHDVAVEKSASDRNNNKIDYTKLYEALDPKLIYTRARRRRDDVKQFVTNALEAHESGNPDGVKKWMLMAKQTHDAVKEEYSGSALRLLPLVVRDTEMLLEAKGVTSENADRIASGAETPELLSCSVKWDSDGNLKPVPLETKKPDVLGIEDKQEKILRITQQNWEKTVEEIPEGSVDKNVFMSVYSEKENTALAELPTEQLMKRKEVFGNMYVAAQQSFCNAVGYLVQKVASIEQFFMHAGNEEGIVESGVIIANCSVSDVEENKTAVRNFLRAASNLENDRIWFAVLPAVIDKDKNWTETVVNPNNSFDDPFDISGFGEQPKNKKVNGVETVTMSDINNTSKLLAEFGILSFFNFNACEATSFKSFGANTKIIEEYNKEVSAISRKDSVVLAYPNFTIIPKNKRRVEMVNDLELWTPSVYIDAAYVAAGIVVATQNLKIQQKKFGRLVNDKRPFIRFDLEEEKNSQQFPTKFNPESRINMDNEVTMMLAGKKGNAFCFRSDTLAKSASIFTARTLNAKPLYCFIVQHYLSFFANRTYHSMTPHKAAIFENDIKNIVDNEAACDFVNKILKSGEEFKYIPEKQTFTLKFNGIDEAIGVNIEVIDNEE